MALDTITGADGGWVLTDIPEDSWTVIKDDEPNVNEEGFDTLALEAVCRYSTYKTAAQVASDWPNGGLYGTSWWVVGCRPKCLGGTIWKVSVSLKGIANGKSSKVRGGSTIEQQSGENVAVSGYGTVDKLQTNGAAPTLSVSFVRTSGSPATGSVGLPASGTLSGVTAPAVRASFWGSITDPTLNYPNGWVLSGVTFDQIPGTTVYFETHNWTYIFEYTP